MNEPKTYAELLVIVAELRAREARLYDACCRSFVALACRHDLGPVDAIRKAQAYLDEAITAHQVSAAQEKQL